MNRYQKGNLYELIHATTLAGISKNSSFGT